MTAQLALDLGVCPTPAMTAGTADLWRCGNCGATIYDVGRGINLDATCPCCQRSAGWARVRDHESGPWRRGPRHACAATGCTWCRRHLEEAQ